MAASYFTQIGALKAATKLHSVLLARIMRSPMSFFGKGKIFVLHYMGNMQFADLVTSTKPRTHKLKEVSTWEINAI
jgi:hypothetical protein